LHAATSEADAVARALAGWTVVRLDGGAATRDAFLAALPAARILHYAGHSEPSVTSSTSGALLLAGRARVDLGDLLGAAQTPEVVILSACQAAGNAFTEGEAEGSMIGLAQAFIASGTRAVIAPTRAVADEDARTFMAAFYGRFANGGLDSLPGAFRRAAMATGSQSFRLVVQ
jgi:CHAT domain-containing protein